MESRRGSLGLRESPALDAPRSSHVHGLLCEDRANGLGDPEEVVSACVD